MAEWLRRWTVDQKGENANRFDSRHGNFFFYVMIMMMERRAAAQASAKRDRRRTGLSAANVGTS